MGAKRDIAERFEEKVDRSAGADQCHEWVGAKQPRGYGLIASGTNRGAQLAHRVAMELYLGRALQWDEHTKEVVMHLCDNTSCCNIMHLRVATQSDNMRDCHDKGRAWQSKVIHCPAGHDYSIHGFLKGGKRPQRMCGICHRPNRSE